MAPPHCAATYKAARNGDTFLRTHRAADTAGFICAPGNEIKDLKLPIHYKKMYMSVMD